jgi:hypothetical protein
MPDAFADFLDSPSGPGFLRLREAMLATPGHDFASDALTGLSDLVDQGAYEAVPDKLAELMPDWLLSPRAHLLAAHAAQQDADADRAQFEQDFSQACLAGLLQSGDGSRSRPYRVTHVADEYDLLEALDKTSASQRRVGGEDGLFDLILCTDGSQLWFDIGAAATTAR